MRPHKRRFGPGVPPAARFEAQVARRCERIRHKLLHMQPGQAHASAEAGEPEEMWNSRPDMQDWLHGSADPALRGWHHLFRPSTPISHRYRVHPPREVFARLVIVFGLFVALIAGALTLLVATVSALSRLESQLDNPLLLAGIGLALLSVFVAAAAHVGRQAFNNVAAPLAELMSAAEAVTAGDLSTRVPEDVRGRFQGIVRTFNTMVASLERVDQQRRNLTADVAHELRTPLQIIQGNLEGILDGVYEPTEEHVEATLEATRQLARLVEDLRTLSLAESDQLALEIERIDVRDLLLDTRTSFCGLADAASLNLRVEADGVEPGHEALTIAGDAGRLDQIMANLVANAIRHTGPGGTITLEAQAIPDGVEICVRDTGDGIAPEDLPFVFDRFWRADRARSHETGASSGLGLAITRQLIRLHGGTIDVTSAVGEGTTFTIRLPAAPA